MVTEGKKDEEAFKAGARICDGDFSRANLRSIFYWKTNDRGNSRLNHNTDHEIADALRLARDANTERSAITVLTALNCVDVPVSSAILTALDQKKYTVIDSRALESLGSDTNNRSVNFYLVYLDYCRRLAREHCVTLRDLDRAL